MFINLSNHPNSGWQKEQLEAAKRYGEIVDLPFPQIAPKMTGEELDDIVSEYYEKVREIIIADRIRKSTPADVPRGAIADGSAFCMTKVDTSSDLSGHLPADAARTGGSIEVSSTCSGGDGIVAVMLQGEMTFTYRLVTRLKADGILCLAACSERKVEEAVSESGEIKKTVIFKFAGFREY